MILQGGRESTVLDDPLIVYRGPSPCGGLLTNARNRYDVLARLLVVMGSQLRAGRVQVTSCLGDAVVLLTDMDVQLKQCRRSRQGGTRIDVTRRFSTS